MNTKLIMLLESLRAFVKREDGASAIEYALIAGIMAVLVIAAFNVLGGSIGSIFEKIRAALEGITLGTPGQGGSGEG